MINKKKILLFMIFSLFMLIFISCGNKSSDNNNGNFNTNSTNKESFDTDNVTPPTNEEYYNYLGDKYSQYLGDLALYNDYDIFVDDFTYNGTYEEFITAYNGDYDKLKTNLEAFKHDLQNDVVKGNAQVDKVNQDVITAIDKAIISVDDYTATFAEKTKDYATLSKDEVVKGLRTLATAPHNAKIELDNLMRDAKTSLGL